MDNILILGAGGTAACNFVKALRLAEELYDSRYNLIGAEHNKYYTNLKLGYDQLIFLEHSKDFTEALNRIIKFYEIDLVYAAPDLLVKRLSNRRKDIECNLFLPSIQALGIASDKLQTHLALKGAQVGTPKTVSFADFNSKILTEFGGRAWVRMRIGAGSKAALPVKTYQQAENWVRYWIEYKDAWMTDFIVSEFLPGREFAFQALFYEGRLITSGTRERLEYIFGHLMPSGQSSSPSVAVTVHDERINRLGVLAIRALDPTPHGIFGVDIKTDCQGEPKVTEINAGRFYTTSDFFPYANGVNMPHLFCQLGQGNLSVIEDVKQLDAVPEGRYWVRGIDREPQELREISC